MNLIRRIKNLWYLSGLQINFSQFNESTKSNDISIKSFEGGEIILPNLIKEKFDEGKVESLKDII